MLGRFSELARTTGGYLHGVDCQFDGIGTDTRADLTGKAFIALVGDRFDGNTYVDAARAAGASGAVVSRLQDCDLPQVEVRDTLLALQDAARVWRQRFEIPVVGVTGSNGKTTTKEMLAAIFSQCGETLSTQGNLNNHIGVPLTLARLRDEHDYAVIEMGANHLGEIESLTGIALPTIGVITHAGDAHLEGFGSRDGVARGKGELYLGLADDGVVVINHDDTYASLWREFAGDRPQISFGLSDGAEVSAADVRIAVGRQGGSQNFTLKIRGESCGVALPLLGEHNLMNALAAAAAATAAGIAINDIAAGLACMKPVAGRLNPLPGRQGIRLIDDTYNANPTSLRAALTVLMQSAGRHWVALGDMAELGPDAEGVHAEMGKLIRDAGVERLYVCGDKAVRSAEAFGEGAETFAGHAELADAIADVGDADVTLLIKGSRSAGMEAVVEALRSDSRADHRDNGGGKC